MQSRDVYHQSTIVRTLAVATLVVASLVASPRPAASQTGASAIVGVVTDSSGAPLPGVAVEATSAALIERMKTTVTNQDGSYQIIDLRPGEFDVSFSIAGFQPVKFEKIVLIASFTATVNAKMPVGGVQETLTVIGQTPVVDVRSNVSERALTQQILEGVPVGRMPQVAVMLMPGAATNRVDVGGSQMGQPTSMSIHGSSTRDVTWNTDGLDITSNTGAGGITGQYPNESSLQEITVQTKALPAAISGGGVSVNLLTKDGGNRFNGGGLATFVPNGFQSRNVSAEQVALGLTAPSATDKAYDTNAYAGGPLSRDRLWFFGSARRFRVDKFEANSFDPDGTQSLDDNLIWNLTGKLTWQAAQSTRISGLYDYNNKLRSHRRDRTASFQFISPEASYYSPLWGPVTNVKVTSVVRSTFVIDGGFSWYHIPWAEYYQPDIAANAFARNDIVLSTLTGAPPPSMLRANQERRTWSATATWLASKGGSHNVQFGTQLSETPYAQVFDSLGTHGDFVARYRNGRPDSVLVYNTPVATSLDEFDFGAFLQDSWTIGTRFTINAGVRFERFEGRLNEQSANAGQFVGARQFAEVTDLPLWTTVVPRLAVSYDLSGDGRTAIKANVSEYEQRQGSALVNGLDPMRQNTEVRTWTDVNADGVPQLGEIGPSLGTLERGANVRVDPNLKRPHQWEYSVSFERQLAHNLGLIVSYYRRQYFAQTATLNTALSASDYTPVTITSPLTGQALTVYNQNLSTRGRVDNVLTNSDRLNTKYNGLEIVVDKRFSRGSLIYAGLTIGANKGCYLASTNPNDLINTCGYDALDSKYLLNLSGAQTLPYGFGASVHLYYATGQPLSRTFTVTTSLVPGLTQVNQNVNLAPVGQYRKDSQRVLDLRLSRPFKVSGGGRIEPLLDLYNLLNENAAIDQVQIVGPALGRISSNVEGRTVKVGVKVTF